MALSGIRKIRTVFNERPKEGGQTVRIRVPQPVERPLDIHGRDVIRRDLLRPPSEGFTLHKRGIKLQKVGIDQLEARAISRDRIRGTLPERIVYLYLVKHFHMKDGIDFDFQSSLSGGRLEMGGLVADFRFELLKIILNVQGPTHTEFLRSRKDEEQRAILEDMGYKCVDFTDIEIYNEALFQEKMNRLFNIASGSGGYSQEHIIDDNPNADPLLVSSVFSQTMDLLNTVGVM